MEAETARCVNDLQARLAALSGVVRLMMWVMRERGITDAEIERQLFQSASEAVASLPPEFEEPADRLLLALQGKPREMRAPSAPRSGLAAGD